MLKYFVSFPPYPCAESASSMPSVVDVRPSNTSGRAGSIVQQGPRGHACTICRRRKLVRSLLCMSDIYRLDPHSPSYAQRCILHAYRNAAERNPHAHNVFAAVARWNASTRTTAKPQRTNSTPALASSRRFSTATKISWLKEAATSLPCLRYQPMINLSDPQRHVCRCRPCRRMAESMAIRLQAQ